MKLYMKQKVFFFKDKFTIFNENGNPKYIAEGEIFTLGKKLHVFDMNGRELIYIRQRIFTFLPKYDVSINGLPEFELKKKFTFFKPFYTVADLDIKISGNFFAHEYEICRRGAVIASLSKKWFTWGDTYELNIHDSADELTALAAVLVIDCVNAVNRSAVMVP